MCNFFTYFSSLQTNVLSENKQKNTLACSIHCIIKSIQHGNFSKNTNAGFELYLAYRPWALPENIDVFLYNYMMSVTLIPARVKHTGPKGHTKCLSVPIKNRRSLNLTPVATSGVGEAPRSIDGSQSTYALVFSFLLCLYICDHLKSGWKICNVSSWFRMKIFFPFFFLEVEKPQKQITRVTKGPDETSEEIHKAFTAAANHP